MPSPWKAPQVVAGDLIAYSLDGAGARWDPAFIERVDDCDGDLTVDLKWLNGGQAQTGVRHEKDPVLDKMPHLRDLNGVWKLPRHAQMIEDLRDSINALAVKIESVKEEAVSRRTKKE